jgi:hypothetical protein
MTTLIAPRPAVKPTRPVARRPAALDGPARTDEDRYELGPDAADDQWHAEHNADWHTDEPTPDDVRTPPAPCDADELAEAGRRPAALPLVDPAGPDWDALADESAALDRLCAGCLL